jgi:hypothetical protein
MKARRFQGPILWPSDRIIIRLGHARRSRSRERNEGGKTI